MRPLLSFRGHRLLIQKKLPSSKEEAFFPRLLGMVLLRLYVGFRTFGLQGRGCAAPTPETPISLD